MASIYLDNNGILELGRNTSAVRVNGSAGDQDRILLLPSADKIVVSNTVEIVDFAGSVADYTFAQTPGDNSTINIYRGSTLVATMGGNEKTAELRFAEGGLTLVQTADGPFELGGQEITSTRAAYTGDGMLTGREHQSQVGGDGPSGKGEDYLLPEDLGTGNIIQSEGGNDTYATTAPNGLKDKAQIIDSSSTDRDVLTIQLDAKNTNGAIQNVEVVNATWTGYSSATLDAAKIQHPNGAEITVSTTRATARDFKIDGAQNHTVTAGEGVTGTLTVNGIKNGVVDAGQASTVILDGSTAATLSVHKDAELTLGESGIGGKNKALTISADSDVTVKGTIAMAGSFIASSGPGKVTLDLQKIGSAAADISNLTVDAVGLEVDTTNTKITVANGQTVLLKDGSTNGGSGAEFLAANSKTGYTVNVQAGEAALGTLTIGSGGQVTTMVLNADSDLTVNDLKVSGAATDSFVITGKGDVTVNNISSGGTVSAQESEGRLIVGATTAVDMKASAPLTIAAGDAGSSVFIGDVKAALDVTGGAGADSLSLTKGMEAAVKAKFAAGAGDDTLTLNGTFVDGSELAADLGEGKDTLKVSGKTDISTATKASISGVEVVDTTGGTLRAGQKAFSAYDFELQGNGLTVVLDGSNLDLSGLTTREQVSPGVTLEQGAKAGGVVTLNDKFAETVVLKDDITAAEAQALTADSLTTLSNFTAGKQDFLQVDGGGTLSALAVKADGATLDAKLRSVATQMTGADAQAGYVILEEAGQTYVFIHNGTNLYAAHIEGTFRAADLAASLGYAPEQAVDTSVAAVTAALSGDGIIAGSEGSDTFDLTAASIAALDDKAAQTASEETPLKIEAKAGNDTVTLAQLPTDVNSKLNIDGGGGVDTLKLDSKGIDLSSGGKLTLSSVEVIDMNNLGATIKGDKLGLLTMTDSAEDAGLVTTVKNGTLTLTSGGAATDLSKLAVTFEKADIFVESFSGSALTLSLADKGIQETVVAKAGTITNFDVTMDKIQTAAAVEKVVETISSSDHGKVIATWASATNTLTIGTVKTDAEAFDTGSIAIVLSGVDSVTTAMNIFVSA